MRFFGAVVTVFGAVLVTFAAAAVVRTAIWGGPALLYHLRARPISSECAAIRAGMTFDEMEARVHSRTWPTDEFLSANRFSFGRWETCEVELDPNTRNVLRAQMLPQAYAAPLY
jgi:hypothetical protein